MTKTSRTAKIAQNIAGNKLYLKRARAALPLLVRQAVAGVPITYSDLAEELGMPNARNLNFPLGSIGQAMIELSKVWGTTVPPIQSLVINKFTRMPGDGIGWFLDKKDYAHLSMRQKRDILKRKYAEINAFTRWDEVLEALNLEPVKTDYTQLIDKAAHHGGGGGEGPAHERLKYYVADHPQVVGLPSNTPSGKPEYCLPSGDSVDVMFQSKDWVAVEVKSAISNAPDIMRGLYQCVKYLAVVEAVQATVDLPQNARALLVLEGSLPTELLRVKNLLGIEVVENVRVPAKWVIPANRRRRN